MNHIFINNKNIHFDLYNGTSIPSEEEVFAKIFTVNTIYFWQNPVKLFEEMCSILTSKGNLFVFGLENNKKASAKSILLRLSRIIKLKIIF